MAASQPQLEPVCGLMPVRNAMPYLRQTLASIAAQDYPALKLIAWDNGSTDGSDAELRAWVPDRIPGIVITGQPLALGKCRATLIEMADCELCAWFDADDLYQPNRITAQVAAIQKQPGVALISAAMRIINSEGKPTGELRRGVQNDADIRWALRFSNPIAQPATMLRRSAILSVGNYPHVPGEEDYEMWLRLSLSYKLTNMDDALVDYRVHDRNITRRFDIDRDRHVRDRQCRLHDVLFPGLGEHETGRLYDALCPHRLQAIDRDDLTLLNRAAQCVATATGIPTEVLRQTRLFRQQRSNLRTRWLKSRPVIRPVWPLLRGAARLAVGKHTPSASKDAAAA